MKADKLYDLMMISVLMILCSVGAFLTHQYFTFTYALPRSIILMALTVNLGTILLVLIVFISTRRLHNNC